MSIPYNLSSWSDVENFFVSSISTSSFYICFLPLLANTRRYIHFVLSLSPLLKDYRGLGYSCSLFLFAFLIVLYWVLSNFVTEALIEGWTKSVNMLAFSLTILVGTSVSRQVLSALETDNYLKIAFFSSILPLVKLPSIRWQLWRYVFWQKCTSYDPLLHLFCRWNGLIPCFGQSWKSV